MEKLKHLMETFRRDRATKYQMAIQNDPDYIYSKQKKIDINNNEVIWIAVDNTQKIPPTPENDIWANGLIKKFYQGVPIQWTIIDEINNKYKLLKEKMTIMFING